MKIVRNDGDKPVGFYISIQTAIMIGTIIVAVSMFIGQTRSDNAILATKLDSFQAALGSKIDDLASDFAAFRNSTDGRLTALSERVTANSERLVSVEARQTTIEAKLRLALPSRPVQKTKTFSYPPGVPPK